MRLFDVIYLDRMPSLMTPAMWKIAGVALSVLNEGEIKGDSEIDPISKVTGLSVQTIFRTLEGSRHLFNVAVSFPVHSPRCYIMMKSVVRKFLLDESRSKNLYFAYRESITLGLKSKIMLTISPLQSRYVIVLSPIQGGVCSNAFP